MSKVDSTVKTETKNIALVVLVLSALMQSVFLVLGKWNYTVLLGNLVGGGVGILNFFLMGVGLSSALDKDQKGAKAAVSFSHTYRQLLIAAVIVASIFVPFLDILATILSIFFSSFGVYIRMFLMNKNGFSDNISSVEDKEEVSEE